MLLVLEVIKRNNRLRFLFIAMFVCLAFLSLYNIAVAYAASRNEVLISVIYDGTSSTGGFNDPAYPNSGTSGDHTPGLDGHAQNLVVRTADQFAVRIDWNINEDAATDASLEVQLPPFAEWNPDNTGMFSGCNVLTDPKPSSIIDTTGDGLNDTLICNLGDQAEGSNGVIRPTAVMKESDPVNTIQATDGDTFNIPVTLKTGEDTSGVTDNLDNPLIVSEAPVIDYIKGTPIKSREVAIFGSSAGYVVLYPFTFTDASQGANPGIGVGPIDGGVDITLYDHMWNLTPGARLATQAEYDLAVSVGDIDAGTPCGDYTQSGAYISGNGTWSCGTPTTSAANGVNGVPYQVVPITIANSTYTTRPAPATLANGTANTNQISSGQIAIWLEGSEVQTAIDDMNNPNPDPLIDSSGSASFDNAITLDDQNTTIIVKYPKRKTLFFNAFAS